MPRSSAMLAQAGRAAAGPISWPRVLREGEGNQSGASGATPGATGSPSAGTTTNPPAGATPPATTTPPPATDGEGTLGDAGKRAIQAEREAREAVENENKTLKERLTALESATLTDQEKAVHAAVRDAERGRDAHWMGLFRTNVVEGALRGAGIVSQEALETALAYPRFGNLKVNSETGVVEGVAEVVEAYKKAVPQLFRSAGSGGAQPGGPWGRAEGGTNRKPQNLEEAVVAEIAAQQRR